MSVLFSARELAEIAVQIERNGFAFYQALAKQSKDAGTAAVFDYLAGQEKQHLVTFQTMLKGIEVPRVLDASAGEESAYVQALTVGRVFVDAAAAQGTKSDLEAVELGLRAEKDSILLYYELQEVVQGTDCEAVEKIIDEEKRHVVDLTGLKEKLGSK